MIKINIVLKQDATKGVNVEIEILPEASYTMQEVEIKELIASAIEDILETSTHFESKKVISAIDDNFWPINLEEKD